LGVNYRVQVAKYFPVEAPETYLYSFLTPEKQVALQSILQNYAFMEHQVRDASGGVLLPADREELLQLQAQRDQELAALLSPEELTQYTMTSSHLAAEMRRDLYGFEPSQKEFDEIFSVRKAFEEVIESNLEKNPDIAPDLREQALIEAKNALNEELKTILGEARYEEYARTQDPDYQSVLKMTERLELPESMAEAVYTMKTTSQKQREEILADPRLNYEQRKLALQAIQAETKASLAQTMGDTNFKAYQEIGTDWLQDLGYIREELNLVLPEVDDLQGVEPN